MHAVVRKLAVAVIAVALLGMGAVDGHAEIDPNAPVGVVTPLAPGFGRVAYRDSIGAIHNMDFVTLNPQPIPPGRVKFVVINFGSEAISLNPQPIPPGRLDLGPISLYVTSRAKGVSPFPINPKAIGYFVYNTPSGEVRGGGQFVMLNPQPIPPGRPMGFAVSAPHPHQVARSNRSVSAESNTTYPLPGAHQR